MTAVAQRSQSVLKAALAAFRSGSLNQAKGLTKALLETEPRYADALSLMGLIEYEAGQFDDAAAWHQKAINVRPDEPLYHCNLATTFAARARFDDAMACYEAALACSPSHPTALAGVIDTLIKQGHDDAAMTRLDPLHTGHLESADPKIVILYARLLQRMGRDHDVAALARTHLKRVDFGEAPRRSLLFVLGKSLDKCGECDAAFRAYELANAIGARPFDPALLASKIATLKRIFAPDEFRRLARATTMHALPVFVVGMPRSGSTLIEQIIDAHPDAHGAGEIPDLAQSLAELPDQIGATRPYPFCVPELSASQLDQVALRHVDRLRRHHVAASRIVDKSLNNFERLGIVAMLFPGATIIHARRNPLDTCLSCFMQDLSPSLHPYSTSLQSLGGQYRLYCELMEHWTIGLGIRVLNVDYEELVAKPESISRDIIAAIGLKWEDRCLQFHENRRDVATLSYDQVRRAVYRGAVGRHQRYAKHLGPLIESLQGRTK